MSSSNYTRIDNTTISGSALLAGLSGLDVNALNFQASLNRNPVITLTGSGLGAEHALTSADYVQAVVDVQLVTGSGLTADGSLTVGADSAAQAAAYIAMFDLVDTTVKAVLSFQVSQATNAAFAVALTGGATFAHIKILAANTGDAATNVLFAATAVAGTIKQVEVSATNVTPGSEVVQFNILATVG